MIPPQANAEFGAAMERVLDVYRRPYDATLPLVCMDEAPRQLIGCTREAIAARRAGQSAREDYEYQRLGVCNVFMACEQCRSYQSESKVRRYVWSHAALRRFLLMPRLRVLSWRSKLRAMRLAVDTMIERL